MTKKTVTFVLKTLTNPKRHYKKLFKLYTLCRYPEKEVEPYPDLKSFIEGINDEAVTLAYANRKLIGFTSFYPNHGFIHLINVHPHYQRNGIATDMLDHVKGVCLKLNYATKLRLMADIKNVSSHLLYDAYGFGRLNDEPIKGSQFDCYRFELIINTSPNHHVDHNYALKEAAHYGITELASLNIDTKTACFTIIQRFNNNQYIKVSIEPNSDEPQKRIFKEHIGADINKLTIHASNQHTIELERRTGYLDYFDHQMDNEGRKT